MSALLEGARLGLRLRVKASARSGSGLSVMAKSYPLKPWSNSPNRCAARAVETRVLGDQEDRAGEAFIGRAERVLDQALEVVACGPWLFTELEAIHPDVLVLGATAAKSLFGMWG
jgi:hypothetical protein